MTKKLSFSVEDAKMINENPDSNFAVLSLDFFASGENLHDMYVSEETLMRTAHTIKNCPLVWKYDERLDDVYTHDKDEVPCGFVPETSVIESRKLPDGRTMLSVIAYVWKRYTGELLNIFKRDGGKKPVSVEMSVFNTKQNIMNGLLEILDFRYEGITVLGSFVTPAIPLANANVLSFAQIANEYNEVLKQEFSFANIDMTIPQEVRENAKKGLEYRKQYGKGVSSKGLSFAKYLINNRTASVDKIRHIQTYFSRHKGDNIIQTDPPSNDYISWLLWGGTESWKWAEKIVEKVSSEEEKQMAFAESKLLTFPYSSLSDINPALKGISPPISLGQANQIAKQADAIGNDGEKNGWAIAISSFKKSHVVKDGKWVKKEGVFSWGDTGNASFVEKTEINSEEKEMAMDEIEKKEVENEETQDFSTEKESSPVAEENLSMAEDKKEEKEEEKEDSSEEEKEEEKEFASDKEVDFEFPENFDFGKMNDMFAEDEDEDIKMAKEELKKEKFANPRVMMGAMFSMMLKMKEKMAKMEADNKVYMEENEELKGFKKDFELKQKNFEVEKTIKELEDKVLLSVDAKEEMLAEAEKYEFSNIEAWKTYCKAKSFEFAIRDNGKSDVTRVGMPFGHTTTTKNNDLWS